MQYHVRNSGATRLRAAAHARVAAVTREFWNRSLGKFPETAHKGIYWYPPLYGTSTCKALTRSATSQSRSIDHLYRARVMTIHARDPHACSLYSEYISLAYRRALIASSRSVRCALSVPRNIEHSTNACERDCSSLLFLAI
jgi:hypothetical protein